MSRVRLIAENLEAYRQRVAVLETATESVDLIYYIWHEDVSGTLAIQEVLRAADRGVRIRILLDALNFKGADSLFLALNAHPSVEVALFNTPVIGFRARILKVWEFVFRAGTLNRRMHLKGWIVDRRSVILGGRNIGDEYFGSNPRSNFSDFDVLIEGAPSLRAHHGFEDYWRDDLSTPLEKIAGLEAETRLTELRTHLEEHRRSPSSLAFLGKVKECQMAAEVGDNDHVIEDRDLRIVVDPPGKAEDRPNSGKENVFQSISAMMSGAQKELLIVSPYFVPGLRGYRSLLDRRRRGVSLGVLTNSLAATDALAVHGGYLKYRRRLLERGVRLWELRPTGHLHKNLGVVPKSRASLHAKIAMVDDEISFIGSFNMDPRSAFLNCEMGVFIRDRAVALRLRELFDTSVEPKNSWSLKLETGGVRWMPAEAGQIGAVSDPEATWTQRLVAWVISFLPVDRYL